MPGQAARERAAEERRRAVVREDDEAAGGTLGHQPVGVREPLGEQRAEIPVDLREALAQIGELLVGEHEQLELGRRAYGRSGRLAGQERHLADRAARCDPPDLVLVAVGPDDDDCGTSGDRDVDLVRRVALRDDGSARAVGAALVAVEKARERVGWNLVEQAHALREARPVAVVLRGRTACCPRRRRQRRSEVTASTPLHTAARCRQDRAPRMRARRRPRARRRRAGEPRRRTWAGRTRGRSS